MDASNSLKTWLSAVLRLVFFAAALLWAAGTIDWWEGWVVIFLWSVYGIAMTYYLSRHDPALLAERLKFVPISKEQKSWDKFLMLLFFTAGIGLYIVPGFDVVRYGWSEPLPLWMRWGAIIIHVPCFIALGLVMRENTHLAQVVKIDKEREHKVITTGPYTIVRHPMYTAVILLLFSMPTALGSRYALLLALFLSLLLLVRTYFEDRTLHEELKGYAEYAKQTRYRLLPGVW